jgi:NhaP-type Na+/H+ and K+/H+ antiporter
MWKNKKVVIKALGFWICFQAKRKEEEEKQLACSWVGMRGWNGVALDLDYAFLA